jgi:hypothetical protein
MMAFPAFTPLIPNSFANSGEKSIRIPTQYQSGSPMIINFEVSEQLPIPD